MSGKLNTFMSFNYNTKYNFLSSLYIFDTEIQKAHIFKIKLQLIVVVFHYCAFCRPVWDVIFATDHSSCSFLCVLDPLGYLGSYSSQ